MDILADTHDWLSRDGVWTQGAFARRADGAMMRSSDGWAGHAVWSHADAEKWCLLGALRLCALRAHGYEYPEFARRAEVALEWSLNAEREIGAPYRAVWAWNDVDGRTQTDVLVALRRAYVRVKSGVADVGSVGAQ
jgi:hypothetical protein